MPPNHKSHIRIPPHNIEAEKALLGSIMLRPEVMYEITDLTHSISFYSEKHRLIFETMFELFSKRNPTDLLSVAARLKEKNLLEEIGGNSYLGELVNSVPSSANAAYYAQIIHKKHIARNLIGAADFISSLGYDEVEELENLLDQAQKKIYDVTNISSIHKFVDLKDELTEAWERLDKLHNSGDGLRGVPSGFKELDEKLSGFQKSDLIILAARPSIGKTALALDIARQAAVYHDVPVGIFSLEMSSQQLVDRMLASQSNVDAWKLRTGRAIREDDFASIRQSLDILSKAPIYIDDQPGNNILKMRSVARRLKKEKGLGLIVVDYLQLMATNKNYDSMVNQVTEISRSLKNLARELEVPVLALSQLSRAIEQRGGKPKLSDLRDSGCISGDTLLIRADNGQRVAIKNLVGLKNIPTFSLDSEMHLKPVLISKVFSNGFKQLFKLTTRSGRQIRASANHQFFSLSGWKRLDNLVIKDRIALPRSTEIKNPTFKTAKLKDEEIILLAHLLGDGCVLARQPIHYTSADMENLKIVGHTAKKLFNIEPRLVKQKNWYHIYLPAPYRLARGKHNPIIEWFKKLDISPVRSYKKRLPEAIFASDTEQIRLFLHHIWSTDGNLSWKYLNGRKPAAAIYYSSSSEQLAFDIQHLLLRVGIWSSIKKVKKENYRINYQVHIQSAPVQLKFCEKIGCFGKRGREIEKFKKCLLEIIPNPNTDTIPQEVWKLFVTPEKEKVGASWRDLASSMDISYNGSAFMSTGLSRDRLSRIAKSLSSQNLAHLAESDIYWDEIISIKPDGNEEVFDATVPETHNFVANDFIIHNSIEQDADVVMFIHREDKMRNKEEAEKTNIAEILIEKHRNGATGKVELFFNEKKATFLPLEKAQFAGVESEFRQF